MFFGRMRPAPDIFVIDSSEENITGEGVIDFQEEKYKLRIVAHSKHPSLIALREPIRIAGTFKDPQVRPEIGPLVARVGAAVALGVFLTPVASLLALVDLGGAKSSNCAALMDQATKETANTPVPPAKSADLSARPSMRRYLVPHPICASHRGPTSKSAMLISALYEAGRRTCGYLLAHYQSRDQNVFSGMAPAFPNATVNSSQTE